ncbi:hypothetical protein An15g02950 [Aspergillus niger]|uniref:Uncharacterized protein n=2 Tax=Aspergillus niger TaxID=5061 RepID=A2R575_ASPNC|nr:hypothetical protein An15g02950 [Aspergillus niger]CAK42370.1 hypothetical protein An15g02950 [Aspergillus niger]
MDRKGVDSRKWVNALPVMRYPIQATITNPSSEDDQGANERHHQTILTGLSAGVSSDQELVTSCHSSCVLCAPFQKRVGEQRGAGLVPCVHGQQGQTAPWKRSTTGQEATNYGQIRIPLIVDHYPFESSRSITSNGSEDERPARPITRWNVDARNLGCKPRGCGNSLTPETGKDTLPSANGLLSLTVFAALSGEADGRRSLETGPTFCPDRSFPLVDAAVLSIPKHEGHHPCSPQAPSYDDASQTFHGGIDTHLEVRKIKLH